jgi:hypothetical protein
MAIVIRLNERVLSKGSREIPRGVRKVPSMSIALGRRRNQEEKSSRHGGLKFCCAESSSINGLTH